MTPPDFYCDEIMLPRQIKLCTFNGVTRGETVLVKLKPQAIKQKTPKEMMSWRVLDDGRWYFKINSSSLTLLQECARKSQYILLRGLKSRHESESLTFGTAIHKGLETFYSGKRAERKVPANADDIFIKIGAGQWELDWNEILVYRSAREFYLAGNELAFTFAPSKHSREAGVWMLSHYFKTYLDDPYVVYEDKSGPMVERDFVMPIFENEKIVIDGFGRIDAVLKNEETGVIMPTDHKTTSQLGSQFYDKISPNFQYSFYSMAANRVFGLNTNGFLVNALQKKDLPKTSRAGPPQFARQLTTRSEEDYQELIDALIVACQNFQSNYLMKFFPQTAPAPCSVYGGCQFRQVCAAPNVLKENIIEAQFDEVAQ